MKRFSTFGMIVLALLLAVPAFAVDRTIYNGIDLWTTRGDGTTFADFSKEPIPAGFFCHKSAPFTGRVVFRGVPLATGTPGVLGGTDTIVQRMDDATFNRRGVATTRIQVRSLNFEGVAPVKTACGLFRVKVVLDGEQPITRMRIVQNRPDGGYYLAPIGVNLKITFEPLLNRGTESLELRRSFLFPADPKAQWSVKPGPGGREVAGVVLADTDGDRRPDTYLPGTSNFAAGWATNKAASTTCHTHDGGTHCVTVYDQPIDQVAN